MIRRLAGFELGISARRTPEFSSEIQAAQREIDELGESLEGVRGEGGDINIGGGAGVGVGGVAVGSAFGNIIAGAVGSILNLILDESRRGINEARTIESTAENLGIPGSRIEATARVIDLASAHIDRQGRAYDTRELLNEVERIRTLDDYAEARDILGAVGIEQFEDIDAVELSLQISEAAAQLEPSDRQAFYDSLRIGQQEIYALQDLAGYERGGLRARELIARYTEESIFDTPAGRASTRAAENLDAAAQEVLDNIATSGRGVLTTLGHLTGLSTASPEELRDAASAAYTPLERAIERNFGIENLQGIDPTTIDRRDLPGNIPVLNPDGTHEVISSQEFIRRYLQGVPSADNRAPRAGPGTFIHIDHVTNTAGSGDLLDQLEQEANSRGETLRR